MSNEILEYQLRSFLVKAKKKDKDASLLAVIVGSIIGLATIIVGIFLSEKSISIGGGVFLAVVGLLFFSKKDSILSDGYDWYDMITKRPEKVIWIKPIVTKHTLAYVITLDREYSWQLMSIDGWTLNINSTESSDDFVFLYGLQKHLKETHFGYSREIQDLYDDDRKNFVKNLKDKGIYLPYSQIDLE